jgi:dihydrodiol dehydrogenase / D-xylose 1-dehydrogenase (NADP)
MAPLRWGILSAGKISNDFCVAQTTLPKDEHQLVAVAARDLENAKDFAQRFNIPKAYGDYEDLCRDAEIDIVYIGAINPQHLKLGKMALTYGKHVLCEKPLCMNVKEAKELIKFAEEKHLFLMEAIWSRFFPAYQFLQEQIENGTVGEIKQVLVTFGVPISEVDRLKLKELGGGTALDIGLYCTQFTTLCFKGEEPVKILAAGHLNDDKVDLSTSTTILYSGGRQATLVTHSQVELPCEAFVVGTKGTIKLCHPFWCATKVEMPGGEEKVFPLPEVNMELNFWNSQGLAYQCHEVRRCILEGKIESSVVSHAVSLQIAEILETIRKQVGVSYPQD